MDPDDLTDLDDRDLLLGGILDGILTSLSTRSYTPTAPIWRHVVAEQATCFRPNCDRPSTLCELDHRDARPAGPTDTANLQPACRADHKSKHSRGFSMAQAADGSLALTTATGFRHAVRRSEHPVSSRWPELPEVQFSATEFVAVLTELRDRRDIATAEQEALIWERQIGQSLQALLAG